MTIKIDRPPEVGEYDEGMQTLLQIVWGDGFLSPGGPEEVARMLEGSDIRGCSVLDIGCGVGGIDILLVNTHGAASVVGIDLEPELVARGTERVAAAGLGQRIDLRVVNGGPLPFDSATFDVVFTKDSLVHIPDKPTVFAEVWRVLKPGGWFIASDWLRGGTGPYSPEMLEYFRLEGLTYNMATPQETGRTLSSAGFVDVELRDRNEWYRDLAVRECTAIEGEWYPTILSRLGESRAQHFVADWRQLALVLRRGELRPAHYRARRPAEEKPGGGNR
jgi:ubiquinone/menaquinone biosynthesis C-methylase UbiE